MITRILVFSLLSLAVHTQAVHADPVPELVQMPIQTVYIPNGFDNNDNAQIIADGYLPSPCYKVGPQKFVVDQTNRVIHLEQWVYRFPGMVCPRVIVPFVSVFDVGILGSNTYDVRDGLTDQSVGALAVKSARFPSTDDYLYAPITDARVDLETGEIVLEGAYSRACLEIGQVNVYRDPKNVIVVLPIMKHFTDDETCGRGRFPFTKRVKLPPIEIGRYLLHVRSMSGQSLNKIFQLSGHKR